ncbi:MAG: TerB family tellurite resistance protein [Rhodospirillales bacterium]|nr:TerB family tellurite resistance protein [Rhodospirillales bacterium]
MSIWGKVIGGVAGFALGGPLGALIGAVAGHAVDKIRGDSAAALSAPTDEEASSSGTRQVAFTVAVIVLGAKMAKADGTVTREEVDAFKEVFRVPPHEMKNVGRIFDMAKKDASGFEPYARQVAWMFRNEPPILEELLSGLFHIAKADGEIHPAELSYLRRVADIFGLDANAFERVRAMFMGPSEADPFEVLGVSRQASNDEIKRAYRKLIHENHPDKLVAQGLPQEFIDLANERMAIINSSYDKIEKQRSLR